MKNLLSPECSTHMPVGKMTVRRAGLWTRTLDKNTSVVLPESVVSRMSGPPPEITRDRTHKGHTTGTRIYIKIPDPSGI